MTNEFEEFETSESEFDAMFDTGQPARIVSIPPTRTSGVDAKLTILSSTVHVGRTEGAGKELTLAPAVPAGKIEATTARA